MNSVTLKLIDTLNAIINLVKGEVDMSEISYMVYTAASLVSKRQGSKMGSLSPKCKNLHICLHPMSVFQSWLISLLREVGRGSLSIRLLHEIQLLQHQLSIPRSDTYKVTINRLKMKLQFNVKGARRLEKNHKTLRQNGLFQRDAERFYRKLGKRTIKIITTPSESEIEQY